MIKNFYLFYFSGHFIFICIWLSILFSALLCQEKEKITDLVENENQEFIQDKITINTIDKLILAAKSKDSIKYSQIFSKKWQQESLCENKSICNGNKKFIKKLNKNFKEGNDTLLIRLHHLRETIIKIKKLNNNQQIHFQNGLVWVLTKNKHNIYVINKTFFEHN